MLCYNIKKSICPRYPMDMKPVIARGLLAAIALVPALSLAAGAPRQPGSHEHGAARLDVVLDESDLVIAMHTPASNVVGFEHRPRDDAERQALAANLERLRDGEQLFDLAADAQCRLESVEIDTPLAGHDGVHGSDEGRSDEAEHDHELDDHAQANGDDDVRHADIDATWLFHCASPGALKSIGVGLFDVFSGFDAIDVQFVGPNGQAGARLTPTDAVISW